MFHSLQLLYECKGEHKALRYLSFAISLLSFCSCKYSHLRNTCEILNTKGKVRIMEKTFKETQKIKEKIQKLLNLANRNPNPQESLAAKLKAYKLISENNFCESDFSVASAPAVDNKNYYNDGNGYANPDGNYGDKSTEETVSDRVAYFMGQFCGSLFVFIKTLVFAPFLIAKEIFCLIYPVAKEWLLLNFGVMLLVSGAYFVLLFFFYPRITITWNSFLLVNLIAVSIFNYRLIIGLFIVYFIGGLILWNLGIIH